MGVYHTSPGSICYAYVSSQWLIIDNQCWSIFGLGNAPIFPATGPGACQ
jgi:hypothetical protein